MCVSKISSTKTRKTTFVNVQEIIKLVHNVAVGLESLSLLRLSFWSFYYILKVRNSWLCCIIPVPMFSGVQPSYYSKFCLFRRIIHSVPVYFWGQVVQECTFGLLLNTLYVEIYSLTWYSNNCCCSYAEVKTFF